MDRASGVSVDPTALSTVTATTVQGALEQLDEASTGAATAAGVGYDNATSGLEAEDVQAALDEVVARLAALEA